MFEKLGIALLLGSLVGLQREKSKSAIAGFRTFPLVTIFGTLCGLLSQSFGSGALVGGLLGVIALILLGNFAALRGGADRAGITTEVALLLMFALGAFLVIGSTQVAVVIGGGVAVLLQFKPELHGFAARLGKDDLKAIMRFVILAFIILPLLPNQSFGPFDVLNPYEIWLLVVFIVGLNLSGYIVSRFVGKTAGTFVPGILGGIISSTATTVSVSQTGRKQEGAASSVMTVILIAWTISYVRVLSEVAAVSMPLFQTLAPALGVLIAGTLILSLVGYFTGRTTSHYKVDSERPAAVRTALIFGATYALVAVLTAAAKKYLGPESLYWVAAASGLTDVDAITLSTSRLVAGNKLETAQARQMILIALLSNVAFKTGIVAVLGGPRLLRKAGVYLGLSLVGAILLVVIRF